NWSSNNGESGSWNSVYNYLQRDIIALKSQFTAGDSNTPSDVFVQLAWPQRQGKYPLTYHLFMGVIERD
ncbi:fimbria/pilus outer membrane usher protein, partial [Salmonella enterica subsp. enterica serovar Kentucky]|nr:fimbria/pilus outer membrane usher protein [Salmonella enterica subsp. enterica serovar Kentucky]